MTEKRICGLFTISSILGIFYSESPASSRRLKNISIKLKFDDLAKSLKRRIFVIPAKAGIQLLQVLKNSLDSGFHRSDDFLRFHQIWVVTV